MSSSYREYDNKEFDVDTGTYMEDVHANDLIGIDKDGNGLVDNVEELIEEADMRAYEENKERARQDRERAEKEENERIKDEQSNDFVLDV